MKIILASSSNRRQQLLAWLFDDFKIIPAEINEDKYIKLARTPKELVLNLAKLKAKAVGDKCRGQRSLSPTDDKTIIISADTTVILPTENDKWQVIGKPKDRDDAVRILQTLRGKTHQVYTGLCLIKEDQIITDFCVTTVTFKNFSDQVLNNYLDQNQYLDKAGSYGIQQIEKDFVDNFVGSYTNIVGLPMKTLVNIFDQFKIKYNPNSQKQVKQEFGHED